MTQRVTRRQQRSLVDTAQVDVGSAGDTIFYEHSNLAPRTLASADGATDALTAATITTTKTPFATTVTIPANSMLTGRILELIAVLDEVTSGTPVTQLFTLQAEKAGPTDVDLYLTSAITPTASQSHRSSALAFQIKAKSPPGAAASIETALIGHTLAGATDAVLTSNTAMPVALDTTVDQVLTLTLTYSGSTTGNVVTLLSLTLKEIAAGTP